MAYSLFTIRNCKTALSNNYVRKYAIDIWLQREREIERERDRQTDRDTATFMYNVSSHYLYSTQ